MATERESERVRGEGRTKIMEIKQNGCAHSDRHTHTQCDTHTHSYSNQLQIKPFKHIDFSLSPCASFLSLCCSVIDPKHENLLKKENNNRFVNTNREEDVCVCAFASPLAADFSHDTKHFLLVVLILFDDEEWNNFSLLFDGGDGAGGVVVSQKWRSLSCFNHFNERGFWTNVHLFVHIFYCFNSLMLAHTHTHSHSHSLSKEKGPTELCRIRWKIGKLYNFVKTAGN